MLNNSKFVVKLEPWPFLVWYKFMRTIQLERLLVVKIVLLHLVCTYQNQN
jgi:hypothetical protein